MSAAPTGAEGAVWRRLARAGALRGPRWFVALAPPVVGFVFYLFSARHRRVVRRNLLRIRPDASGLFLEWEVMQTFVAFARNLTESLAPERFRSAQSFRVRGLGEEFDRDEGRIIVTAHVGPWDACAAALRRRDGPPMMMLMGEENDAGAARVQDEIRRSENVEVLRIGSSPLAALPALDHLNRGGVLVAQIDRVSPGQEAVSGTLFGQPFAVPRGLFQLAGIARVEIFVVLCARLESGRQLIEIGAPLRVSRRPTEAELQSKVATVLAQLERHLAAFPRQWFHFV